ncbi:MAG: AAA-like domain-containing protein [Thermoflexibacter sp.]|jgi:hypothetical protein|nr:AAA-like domain-containing protein [Thermoflexibacter sp.]
MSPYTATNFYQIGGSLPSNSPSYVKRKADDDLFYHLKGGHFCYVLTARQMGKSSLRVQTMKRLMEHGFLCSAIDLTSIGTHNVSAEQWYYSLLDRISYDLGIFEEFEAWWEDNLRLSPVSRFGNFLEQVVLKQKNQPIAIFLDEIDTVLSLNSKDFNTDDFFAVIRSFYNARDNNTDFNRLNFALFGVASPDALMRDTVRTPFNIGVPIYLENFHFDESKHVLMQGFAEITQESEKLLKIVFDYTSGQPYLTQKICAHLLQKRQIINNEEVVKQIVEQLFLSHDNGELDANLANIQNRISSDTTYGVEMLHIYQDLLNKNSIAIKRSDPTHIYLRLSGLVSESKGFLKIDNKIYEQFFNKKWVVELLGKLDRPFTYDLERWLNSGKNDSATALRGTLLQEMREWSKKKLLTDLEKEFLIFSQDIDLEEKDRAYKAKESERNALQLKQEKKEGKALKMRNIALLVALAITILASVITINIQRRYLNADKELDEKIAELSKREQQYNQLLDRNDDLTEEIDAKADSALAYSIKLRELQEKYGAILKQLETGEKETNDDNNNAAQIAELNALKKALSQLRTDTMNLRQQIRNLQKKSELADKPVPEQICRTARLAIIQFKYGDDNQFEQGIYKTHTERNTKFIARELIDKKTFTNLRSIKQDYFENFVDKETIRSQGYEGYISGNFIPSRSGDIVARIDVYIFGQSKPCTNFVITGIPEKTFFDNSKISIDQIKERYKDVIQNMPTQMRFSFGN